MTCGQFDALKKAVEERKEVLKLRGDFEEMEQLTQELKYLEEAFTEVVKDNLPF